MQKWCRNSPNELLKMPIIVLEFTIWTQNNSFSVLKFYEILLQSIDFVNKSIPYICLQPIVINFFDWQHRGTEELAHLEMVGTIVHQLTKNASIEEIEAAGLGAYYTDHGVDIYPQSAAGVPFDATCLACKGDVIANLQEDLAAEQKARATYEKLIDLCRDNPDVVDPLRFLREREIVHFQRFGEALRIVQDKLSDKKFCMNDMNNIMQLNNNCGR